MSDTTILRPVIHANFGDDTARTRRNNPTTSHEAADTNDVSKSIGWVLSILAKKALADHELVQIASMLGLPYTGQRLRTARASLTQMGLVEESGFYRLTENRRRAIVWQFNDDEKGTR